MGLFGRQLIDIIEWLDNTNDTIAYRFERSDNEIKQGAQLIVRPGQKAVFVNEGFVADEFTEGTYELYTRNLPILTSLKSWKYGFESPFKAEVYFFSTRIFSDLKWGTSNPIMIRDNEMGPVRIRAFGSYSIRVSDPRLLLEQVIGTDGLFQVHEISNHLRNVIVPSVTGWVASSGIALLDFAANYRQMGDQVKAAVQSDFTPLGVEIAQLTIENISLPKNVEEALDKRSSMGILGNMQDYTQYQTAEAIENFSQQPGGSNPGMGMGMGMAMGQQMANAMQPQAAPAAPPPPPGANQWYMSKNGQQVGPAAPQQLAQQGLTPDTLVWCQGMSSWLPAAQVPTLASLLPPPPPPMAAPPPPPPMADAPPPPPADETPEWYIFRSGDRTGPFTKSQLVEQGVTGRTNVWRNGQGDWQRARDIPDLADLITD
jgi:membrane protease subunit (stomatin/prohibitin family)